MTVQTCLGIECTFVGDLQLVYGIVIDLFGILGLIKVGCCQTAERQSHENTIKPYLISIYGLVPEYLVGNSARLFLQLLHHGLDGLEVLGLRVEVVHTSYEMSGTYIVKVIIQDVVAADVTFVIDHRVGIFLAILADILATIFDIGVKHTLEFDTHYIAPFWLS